MSFRRRTVLLVSAAVALAVMLASVVVYVLTEGELGSQLDASLSARLIPGQKQSVEIRQQRLGAKERRDLERQIGGLPPIAFPTGGAGSSELPYGSGATVHYGPGEGSFVARATKPLKLFHGGKILSGGPHGLPGSFGLGGLVRRGPHGALTVLSLVLPAASFGGQSGYAQLLLPSGEVVRTGGSGATLPIGAATRAVAAGKRPSFFSDATVHGSEVRVLTERAPGGGVWQVAMSLTDLNSTLKRLLLVLAAVSLGGVLLAAALGLLVSRAALAPVRRLTGATERVARTQDLAHRIPVRSDDELGRLAASFNTMLAALERSRLAQRQLVSDASHELRTPLTSVQVNLEALALDGALDSRGRAKAIATARAQLHELALLVGDLVNLSKTEVEEAEIEELRLDLAVAGAVDRARVHAPRCVVRLDASPCIVRASPGQLDRAVSNLLDNAIKWSPPGGAVEVRVGEGRVEVRDHGPGIAVDDLPRVFDRFYRAPAARGRPGSGLGLAIVRQLAETHRGAVHAANDPGGGARLTLELPAVAMSSAELSLAADALG